MLQGKAGKKKKKRKKKQPALGSYGEVYPVHKLLLNPNYLWLTHELRHEGVWVMQFFNLLYF